MVRVRVAVFVLAVPLGACQAARAEQVPIVQPGAPGEPTRVISAEAATALPEPGYTAADVAFMQGMIGHHAQALEMVELLATRTESDDMRRLAKRIEVSQADEIRMMREWLTRRGQRLPDPHAHHGPGGMMPGMLSAEEMARLAASTGREFDKLFLEFMIRHHEGALVMVKELFAAPGAAQEGEIFTFAADVEADQRAEILRMAAMLKELEK